MRYDPSFRRELDQAIDYSSVLSQIAGLASTDKGAMTIMASLPLDDGLEIRHRLDLAAEALRFVQRGSSITLSMAKDIENDILRAQKSQTLLPAELMKIAIFLQSVENVVHAFDADDLPGLHEIASSMAPCAPLRKRIDAAIDLSGQIKDDATPELRSLNRQLDHAKASVAAIARKFVQKNSSFLADTITTSIGGRVSVLLKAAEKNRFGGMIHGSSQSGQAFYAEPSVLVEANNNVQALKSRIEEEKSRICMELSAEVRKNASVLLSNAESLVMIDIALAKGSWASAKDGVIPQVVANHRGLLFEHARHPLIDSSKVVANDYRLLPEQSVLMISGPNMGGKTVTLKTIGLFVALAQAGFPVVAHRAIVPLFDNLFFDIGDNQSIENNLSTFSAHIARIAEILNQSDDRTFVLLDEIGNGTDPQEGAMLAQAVLEELAVRKTTVITSTHFSAVKAFGKSDDRILVSSVEFNPDTMQPTYRYLPGVSGASYAFSIAANFGLDPSVLKRAEDLCEISESETQKQLRRLEVLQQQAQKEKDRFKTMIEDAHRLQKEADHKKEVYESRKKRLDEEYEARLDAMLEEKRQEAKAIVRELRQRQNHPDHENIELASSLNNLAPEKKEEKRPVDETLKPGDYVMVEALGNHGEILSIKKKKAQVLVAGKKVQVSLDQLKRIKKPQVEKQRNTRPDRTFEAFPLELNIIGMHVEEGIQALDHYLDQAVYKRIKSVRIIHGMGTGALRNAVWQDLRSQPNVKSFRAGGPSDGGLGATLVELK